MTHFPTLWTTFRYPDAHTKSGHRRLSARTIPPTVAARWPVDAKMRTVAGGALFVYAMINFE